MSANIAKYRQAFDVSQALLDIAEINTFPIDMFEFLRQKKGAPILVKSIGVYNAWNLSQHPSKWNPIYIKDAKCLYYPSRNVYMILYNESQPETRIRFSLAHELAHIVLGHLNDERTELERGGLDDIIYFAMEGAANTFAGNFLAPPILIHELVNGKSFDIGLIATVFNISHTSVQQYRAEDYKWWLKTTASSREQKILNRCRRNLHQCTCKACGATFSIAGANFCPICGNALPDHKLREELYMGKIYSGVELREDGYVIECPQCGNLEVPAASSYCLICGVPNFNYCMDAYANGFHLCSHTEKLPGNARYCPYCGKETAFLNFGLLKKYFETEDEELPF